MPSPEMLSVACGLASAATWGAGDFSGGLATRRIGVLPVIVFSQAAGGLLLAAAALALGVPLPGGSALTGGALAGIAGAAGLTALYQGLAAGRMGVVAPVAAVVSMVFPIAAGAFYEGPPPASTGAGFLLAFGAVWLLTRSDARDPVRMKDLGLPVCAGIGFGLFFVLVGRVSADGVLWPLVAARVASVALLLPAAKLAGRLEAPLRSHAAVIALAGVFDGAGNVFFALAARFGRLDISAVLSSLYPGITALLAWIVLKETLTRRQWAGVCAALAALAWIAG